MTMLPGSSSVGAQVARAARTVGDRDGGWVIGFHPVATMNPYQALLYSRAHASGFAPVGLVRRSDFGALKVATAIGASAILHLHWTSEVLSESLDEEDASKRVTEFIQELHDLRREGIYVVWTVHNVLPHRCPYPGVEAQLREELADLADVLHVMAGDTIAETSAHYSLPEEKVIEVPHPSYIGAYPNFMERPSARFELGYEPSDLVVGMVGSIQPYKGLSEFALAVEHEMQRDPDLRALVAGIPGGDEESRRLVTELQSASHLALVARQLSDAEIATVVLALDAVVLPYRVSLNSGAALLALSFGVPIVAPAIGSLRHFLDQGLGVGYEPGLSDGLRQALGSVRGFLEGFKPEKALEVASSLTGPIVSERFFLALREKLSRDR